MKKIKIDQKITYQEQTDGFYILDAENTQICTLSNVFVIHLFHGRPNKQMDRFWYSKSQCKLMDTLINVRKYHSLGTGKNTQF